MKPTWHPAGHRLRHVYAALATSLVLLGASRAGACESDVECNAPQFCDSWADECAAVPADWCQTNADCEDLCDKVVRGDAPAPRFGTCVASWTACSDADACASDQVCRATLRKGGNLGATCQPALVECEADAQCPERFECVQDGALLGSCFPAKVECESNPDCGVGWACIKFDDDGDQDELLAPPSWGIDAVMACVPVSWALSSWMASAPDDVQVDAMSSDAGTSAPTGTPAPAATDVQSGGPSPGAPAAPDGPTAQPTSNDDASGASGCTFTQQRHDRTNLWFTTALLGAALRRRRQARPPSIPTGRTVSKNC